MEPWGTSPSVSSQMMTATQKHFTRFSMMPSTGNNPMKGSPIGDVLLKGKPPPLTLKDYGSYNYVIVYHHYGFGIDIMVKGS